MKNITFQIDYEFCPKGHKWIFLPSSLLCYDLFYCEPCGTFYEPTVKPKSFEAINKEFSADQSDELIQNAKFRQWKNNLTYKDFNHK